MTWEKLAEPNEIPEAGRKSVFIGDIPALLIFAGGQYYAIEDLCTHDGQPLTDGKLVNGAIQCPRHGARFDLATGKALCMPATRGVKTFATEIRPDGIYAESDE